MNLRSIRSRLGGWIAGPSIVPSLHAVGAEQEKSEAPGTDKRSVTLAQTFPFYIAGRPYRGSSDWSGANAIQEGLKANPWVYACVQAYVWALSLVPHKVQQWNGQQWEDMAEHPVEERFSRPNKFMSRADLITRNLQDLFLTGNFLSTVIDSSTTREPNTLELWPITPDKCEPVPDAVDLIQLYRIRRTATVGLAVFPAYAATNDPYNWLVKPKDLVHCQFQDPANPFWGLSPLVAASKVIDTDVAAIQWNYSMLENRAVAGGVFTTPQPLSPAEHRKLKELIDAEVSGAENAYSHMLLSHGTSWAETSRSPVQMDFIEGRKLSREEICAVFRVPPPIVGISENATLANLSEYHKGFYEDSVIPLAGIITDAYNRAWIWPRWGPNYRLVFDFSKVPALWPQLSERISDAYKLYQMGYPINVVNRALGLGMPAIEGGDVSWAPSNMVPLADEGTALLDPSLQSGSKTLALIQRLEKRLGKLERRSR